MRTRWITTIIHTGEQQDREEDGDAVAARVIQGAGLTLKKKGGEET